MSAASSPQFTGLPGTHSLPCPNRDCHLRFSSFDDLYEHYDGFHPLSIILPDKAKQYKCPFCSKRYTTERYMRGHTNKHKPKLPGSAESQDQEALFRESRIAMEREQRSQAPTTNENTPNHNSEHENQGSEAQASCIATSHQNITHQNTTYQIITPQDPDSLSSAQPNPTSTTANQQRATESTPDHRPMCQNQVNSTQANFTAQRKRRGSQLLAPRAEKTQKSRDSTPHHKVILDEMVSIKGGDLILPITQTIRKAHPSNHASAHYLLTAYGRPWGL